MIPTFFFFRSHVAGPIDVTRRHDLHHIATRANFSEDLQRLLGTIHHFFLAERAFGLLTLARRFVRSGIGCSLSRSELPCQR